MRLSNVFLAARQLLNDGRNWIKGSSEELNPATSERGYCITGVLNHVVYDTLGIGKWEGDILYDEVENIVIDQLSGIGVWGNITDWNDATSRQWPEIERLLKAAEQQATNIENERLT